MARSKFRLGNKIINTLNLGISDISIYLGIGIVYPLRPIANAVITCTSTTYNGNNQIAQTITVVFNGETLIEGTDYNVISNSGGINAGNYTVTVEGINRYEGTLNGTFTINKANITYTAPTAKSLTYNGSAQALLNAGSNNVGTMQYSNDESNWSTTIPTGTNANNYTSYWRIVGNNNYNDVASASINTTIVKADQSAPVAQGSSVAYGNTATASASGGGSQGSIEWSNGNTLTGNAGSSKTTKARWSGNNNYNPSPYSNEVTLSIVKANQSAPTATGKTTTYPTTATATASGGGGQGTLTWTNGNSQTSVGSKKTKAYWAGNSNYNASSYSNEVTVQMDKATGSASVSGVSLTFNNSSRNLVTVSGNTGTMHYRVGTSGSWTTTIPTSTNAGSWTIYYYMDASTNYTARGSSSSPWGSVSSSIAKANQSAPTATGATTTYSTTATATASGGGGQGSIEWSNGNTQTSVGSKSTKARWSGNNNYNASSWSNSVTLTMNKASQSAPTATGATVDYGSTAVASASGGGGQGSIQWSNGNTRTAVGSQTTKARWSGNSNYNASPYSNEVTLSVSDTHNGYKFVDLGLPSGTKWATMNVGASTITDYGNYYLWGYGDTVYSYGQVELDDPQGNRNLTDDEDTARKVWGGSWHMPTLAQIKELTHINNTSKSVTTVNGVNMFKLTSKHNSNYVLFPFPGEYRHSDGKFQNNDYTGNYWSRTPDGTSNAYILSVVRLSTTATYYSEFKSEGFSVRPVLG